jgi:hypothetical protein
MKSKRKQKAKGMVSLWCFRFKPYICLNFYSFALEPVSKYSICKNIIFDKISDWLVNSFWSYSVNIEKRKDQIDIPTCEPVTSYELICYKREDYNRSPSPTVALNKIQNKNSHRRKKYTYARNLGLWARVLLPPFANAAYMRNCACGAQGGPLLKCLFIEIFIYRIPSGK